MLNRELQPTSLQSLERTRFAVVLLLFYISKISNYPLKQRQMLEAISKREAENRAVDLEG